MRLVLFWSAVGLLMYAYIGFPGLVLLRSSLRPRPFRSGDLEPPVSVIIAAHNEQSTIADRLDDLLASDYPAEQLDILVASDGSVDHTDEIVRGYADRGVRLLSLPRGGKARALNAAVAEAHGEILVFTDANTQFDRGALRALVRPFADPAVGGVAGDQRYVADGSDLGAAAGEQSYWDLDRRLKVAQSRAGNVISATGAIYAIRRGLYQEIPTGVTDDFYVSTGVVAQGQRLVFAPDALAFEAVAPSASLEFGRKVRVVTQGLRAIGARRALLDPRRSGFYAVQLLSHKILRRLMVVPLLVLAFLSPTLWAHGFVYQAATLGQTLLVAAALAGLVWPARWGNMPRAIGLPLFFCMVNAACLVALGNVLRGRRIDRWQPQRVADVGRRTEGGGLDAAPDGRVG